MSKLPPEDTPEMVDPEDIKHEKTDAKVIAGTGLGIGAYGTAMAATTGIVCTACAIAAPVLIGYGVYKHHRAKKKSSQEISEN